jgi:hypothetical protein
LSDNAQKDSDWSNCPKNCTEDGVPNFKTRKVKPDSIVQARGSFAEHAPCPPNLLELEVIGFLEVLLTNSGHFQEHAPCNTHACAKNLSAFDFRHECWPVNASEQNSTCYQIRNIPTDDVLVSCFLVNFYKSCIFRL